MSFLTRHLNIIGALMMREMTTRFGREGIGFLWVVGEPLMFCLGVLTMWSIIRPAYEHGIRLGPIIMTGYMCLVIYRHMIGFSIGALNANVGLLHHRQVGIMHIFISRNLLEFAGGTAAFIIVYCVLGVLGQVGPPKDLLLLYTGWLLVGWTGFGVALIFAGLAVRFDIMERLVPLLTYLMVPLSGAFMMVAWIPDRYHELFLLVPFPNAIEMVRGGVFGEFVHTYHHPLYALVSGGVMLFIGMILLAGAKNRITIE